MDTDSQTQMYSLRDMDSQSDRDIDIQKEIERGTVIGGFLHGNCRR